MYTPKHIERVICVDIGGGTSDITTMSVMSDDYGYTSVDIWKSFGVRNLGGDQLDSALTDVVLQKLVSHSNISPEKIAEVEDWVDDVRLALDSYSYSGFKDVFQAKIERNPMYKQKIADVGFRMKSIFAASSNLRLECEKAKIALSGTHKKFSVNNEFGGAGVTSIDLSKSDFDSVIDEFLLELYQTIDKTIDATTESKRTWTFDDITILLFTGQTTYSSQLRKKVEKYIYQKRTNKPSKEEIFVLHPDPNKFCPKSCVAKGASLWPILVQQESAYIGVNDRRGEVFTYEQEDEIPYDLYFVPSRIQRKLPSPVIHQGSKFPVVIEPTLRKGRDRFDFFPKSQDKPIFTVTTTEDVKKIRISISSITDKTKIIIDEIPEHVKYEVTFH